MLYTPSQSRIPQEKRSEINDKIIHLINSNQCSEFNITGNDIFNLYTGIGGLHGLSRNEFKNYHQYSEAKKEIENGQFFTPHHICEFILSAIKPSPDDFIGDLTCGMGNFANHTNPINFYGCDIDLNAVKVAKHLFPESNIVCEDIRLYDPGVKLDVVVGNPPFNIDLRYEGREIRSQMLYFVMAHKHLSPGGIIGVIAPESFLNDEFFCKSDIERINSMFDFIVQIDLDPNAFESMGVKGYRTKVMFFRKRSDELTHVPYSVHEKAAPGISASAINLLYIEKFKKESSTLKKISKVRNTGGNKDFDQKVSKLLFDIKRNPKLSKFHPKDSALARKFYTQTKPPNMDYEEWQRTKISEGMVLSHLKKRVRNQHVIEQDKINLVKTNYGLKMKGYSHKSKAQVSKLFHTERASFYEMIDDGYRFQDHSYRKLVNRKRKARLLHNKTFCDLHMEAPEKIIQWVKDFELYHSQKKLTFKLTEPQQRDVVNAIMKECGILNWKQGSGKTIAGIAWFTYFLTQTPVRNVFIVSEALAIKTTWRDFLSAFGIDFIQIKSLSDVRSLKPGMVAIISNAMAIKYQKAIKRYIRIQSKKVCVVIDESDEMTNNRSKRTLAYLNCFRKVKNILLTTGTTTRNNIAELYSQLEIIYNNSNNMINRCEYIYEQDKNGGLDQVENDQEGQPFHARSGAKMFRKCFNPHKVTVFGITKHDQNIFNQNHLLDILKSTIITRSFEDIVGKKIHEVITHRIKQTEEERTLYGMILRNIVNAYQMFKKCDNSRKDAMLRIIRQIQMMIKAASIPHTFNEYDGGKPGKFFKICEIIDQNPNEKIAIGTVFVETVNFYAKEFETRYFMNRPVFIADGRYDIHKRKKIIEEFERTHNGILLSTQKALKSSINIPTCNIAIIESLPWNIPRLEQYFYRFIRFDSIGQKKIIIVTYDNTIEQNILGLLMAKERVNQFVNTLEDQDLGGIYDEYDIDLNILDCIIEKQLDSEGHVHLAWGSQNF